VPHEGTAEGRPRRRTAATRVAALACVGLAWGQAGAFAADQKLRDLTELTPEQLANIEVTSVAKKPEKRSRTPAAVYVITRDQIRRSGVTTLVDALRLAPGIHVARIDSNKWAVGIRGFASSLTRSVLVMIDGRTVYTPLFAGTYWEVQDTLLEDVERIEVIRGPGGSLWGANAVNGVINIITRGSRDTQGAFVKAGGGTMEHGMAGIRYGGTAGEGVTYRAYAKGFERGAGFHATTSDFDDWRMARAGFRTDWERTSGDTVRVHLTNGGTMTHSIDFHASQTAMNHQMVEIEPGGTFTYTFTADYAGVWMYHCGTAPALHHIANGMFGMVIVEPKGGLPKVDQEFAFVQSEWYLGKQKEPVDYAKAASGAPAPDFVVFNGIANQYKDNPLQVTSGGRVRVFILDAGPSIDSSFHVVGTIFNTVVKEGMQLLPNNPGGYGSQAVDLSPAQGAFVEFTMPEDGLYPMVTHAFNFVGKGAIGIFMAGDGDPKN